MEYQLTIQRFEKNPEYKKPENGYHDWRTPNQVSLEIELPQLSVRISEVQFEAIRKAVLEKF